MPARRTTAGFLFALCFIVYNANLRYTGSFDSLASSRLPFRILTGHGLTLQDPGPMPGFRGISYAVSRSGKWVSLYPVFTPIVLTPLYVPAVWIERSRPWVNRRGIEIAMEKLSASLIAALSAAVMFLTLRKIGREKLAMWLTIAYAFGTSTWAISSQSLWPHGMGELLLSCALYLLAGRVFTPARLAALGLLAAFLAANRPTDLVFSLALAAIVLYEVGRRSWPFFAAAAPIAALLLAYNLTVFGTLTGGYGQYRFLNQRPFGLEPIGVSGLFGLLFSNRGIFVFSPFLLLFFLRRWKGAERIPGLRALLLAYFGSLFLHGLSYAWMGGSCYGPRYAIHGLPVLIVALMEPLERIWKLAMARAAFAAAVVLSIGIQAIGAFFYPDGDSGNRQYGLWSLRRSAPIVALRSGPAVPDFPLFIRSPVRHHGLDPSDAVCRLEWAAPPPSSMRPGELERLRIRVTHMGRSPWSSIGGFFNFGAVRTRCEWLDDRGNPISEFSGWLAYRIDPGATIERTLRVTAPLRFGPVRLEVGLQQDRVGPFPVTTCPPLRANINLAR